MNGLIRQFFPKKMRFHSITPTDIELAMHRLPKPFWRLPKHGFSAPIDTWIRELPGHVYEDEVLGPTASIGQWVDLKELTRHYREHREGTVDRGYILWACWVLERWLRTLEEE